MAGSDRGHHPIRVPAIRGIGQGVVFKWLVGSIQGGCLGIVQWCHGVIYARNSRQVQPARGARFDRIDRPWFLAGPTLYATFPPDNDSVLWEGCILSHGPGPGRVYGTFETVCTALCGLKSGQRQQNKAVNSSAHRACFNNLHELLLSSHGF